MDGILPTDLPRLAPSTMSTNSAKNTRPFEKPTIRAMGLHTACCIFSYLFTYLVFWWLPGYSLYIVRTIASAVGTVVSVLMTTTLLPMVANLAHAAVWNAAMSKRNLSLQKFSKYAKSSSKVTTLVNLLFHPRLFAHRRCSIGIALSLALCCVIGTKLLSFAVGRAINIEVLTGPTEAIFQSISGEVNYTTPVATYLTDNDLAQAVSLNTTPSGQSVEDLFLVWDFIPPNEVPSPINLEICNSTNYMVDHAWFTEVASEQFGEQGKGLGAILSANYSSSATVTQPIVSFGSVRASNKDSIKTSTLRWYRWGVASRCQKLDDIDNNLSITGSLTDPINPAKVTVTVPQLQLSNLTNAVAIQLPQPDLSLWNKTIFEPELNNLASLSVSYDFIPVPDKPAIYQRTLVFYGLFSNYTATNSSFSTTIDGIGIEAAICVSSFQLFCVDTRNTSGVGYNTWRIVDQSGCNDTDTVLDMWGQENVMAALNNTRDIFLAKIASAAIGFTYSQEALSLSKPFIPTPLIVSFTGGSGPAGYTTLDVDRLADVLDSLKAQYMLPLLVGSGVTNALAIPDLQIAFVSLNFWGFAIVVGVTLLAGLLAACIVPTLPDGVPHRDSSLISWVAAIFGDGMLQNHTIEGAKQPNVPIETLQKDVGRDFVFVQPQGDQAGMADSPSQEPERTNLLARVRTMCKGWTSSLSR